MTLICTVIGLHPGTTESDTILQVKGKHITRSGTSLHITSSYICKANLQIVNWPLHILSGPALALSYRLPGAVCHRCHLTMPSLTGNSWPQSTWSKPQSGCSPRCCPHLVPVHPVYCHAAIK